MTITVSMPDGAVHPVDPDRVDVDQVSRRLAACSALRPSTPRTLAKTVCPPAARCRAARLPTPVAAPVIRMTGVTGSFSRWGGWWRTTGSADPRPRRR